MNTDIKLLDIINLNNRRDMTTEQSELRRIIHEEVSRLLMETDVTLVEFKKLDSLILKTGGSSCNHKTRQTSDRYWFETDGIFIASIDTPDEIIHYGETVCTDRAYRYEYVNCSYALQWQQYKPTLLFIDEERFNRRTITALQDIAEDIRSLKKYIKSKETE